MTPAERWQKVEAIMQSALDIESSAERKRFVSESCAGDEQLRNEVERLLIASDQVDSFIESPAWMAAGDSLDSVAKKSIRDSFGRHLEDERGLDQRADDFARGKIGVFELKKELGRGGMGAVYLAERADGEFRQKVAVKLIKRGMDTDFIVKRFRHERQILAALSHPNIARLIDGGTTDDGLPYFVMEYVEGSPLYRFCDERKLKITERLDLFRRVCEAVDAAHQIKVIHRDLKPSNILVKPDGAPKLLDFGIAKILDPELADMTLEPTATAMRMMTPEYASPEQVSGEPVTFASDIYSLGVVLYELLTGHRPYRFKSRAPYEIARVICEEEPIRPSTGVTREDNLLSNNVAAGKALTLSDISLSRGADDIKSLQKELSGEIEKVILKCLRKNPGERYQSAAELAADITRCLSSESVVRVETTPPLPSTIESDTTQTLPAADKKAFSPNGKYKFGLALISVVLILGALVFVFVSRSEKSGAQSESQNQQAPKRSVAILPFRNETSDPENDFLCDGMSENLINRLSYLPETKVMSRSASFKYKGSDVAPEQAGREMNVAAVLSGKLSKSDDKLAIFLELIDVSDGSLIRSFQYGGKESELVFLQNKMAGDVVEQFKTGKASEQKQIVSRGDTENREAFELYLKGEFERQKGTREGNRRSIELYKRALELDANYALAYQGLALSARIAPAYRTLEPQEAYPMAKEAAMKALAIEPTLGAAYLPLASIKFAYDWDFAGAENEYRQAITLVPNNPEIRSSYGSFLNSMGRSEEALNELKIAQQFDPQSTVYSLNIAWALYLAGRFDEGESQLREILERDPNNARAYSTLGEIYSEQNRFDEALESFQKGRQLSPDAVTETVIAYLHAVSGRRSEALKIAAELESKAQKKEVQSFLMAEVYAGLNDKDKAFYWLERAFQERSNWLVFTKVWRRLKPLHSDPRFDDLLKRIGFENPRK